LQNAFTKTNTQSQTAIGALVHKLVPPIVR
jgi:hypothetical protein